MSMFMGTKKKNKQLSCMSLEQEKRMEKRGHSVGISKTIKMYTLFMSLFIKYFQCNS